MSYYEMLETRAQKVYELAGKAREKGLDASLEVEVPPAKDLAARIEGLVGPHGVAKRIRELKMERELVAKKIVDEIIDQKLGEYRTKEELIEQAIRTSLALYTEGVVAAPIEGISRVEIVKDPEGSFLSVYYAGPIRSAGGSAQAFSVIVAEYIREKLGISPFRPSKQEVERILEEVNMYHERVARLQYLPSEDEVRNMLANLKVSIDGDPTSEMEVSINKNLPRVKTNRIRGGICLVLCEGIAQKAAKLVKLAKKFDLDWSWLRKVKKEEKKEEKFVLAPSEKYLKDIVAGRPIVAHPSRPGAFRLRYGRARNTGIAAKAIHPATMIILDDFFAVGTQMKIERPGKGTVSMPCDSIEGPIVRLRNGDVVKVQTSERAHELKNDVEKVLFLGDLLVPYGDFKKTNHPLIPSPYVEEWWTVETGIENIPKGLNELVDFCDKNNLPLHPSAIYYYSVLNLDELKQLYTLLKKAEKKGNTVFLTEGKELLEKIGCEHKVRDKKFVIENAYPLLKTIDTNKPFPKGDSVLAVLNKLAPFEIRDKAPVFVGARMGRPEKARERKMSPAPHVLFPVGDAGGKTRTIPKAAERDRIFLDIARYRCRKCSMTSFLPYCQKCGARTELVNMCSQCGRETKEEACPNCKAFTNSYDHMAVDIGKYLASAEKKLGVKSAPNMKGVRGTVNHHRVCESIEKGILRSKHGVFVFKDGTIRFDATDIPLTHFRPEEIGTSIETLHELGYTKDYRGQDLTSPKQLVELRPQDVLVPLGGVEYLINTTRFIDELLEKFYGLEKYYNVENKEGLVGNLVVGLAPHTSAGVLGRIIGFSPVSGLYAHPFFHAAKRRNADGDEDSIMLLMDVLLNFSKMYLPESRGGRMDAPLVLSLAIDPKEVDDEVHEMEVVERYPLELYKKSLEFAMPSEVKVATVGDRLGSDRQDRDILFTHDCTSVNDGVIISAYKKLKTMEEKVVSQLQLATKIQAADAQDVASRVLNTHFLRDLYGNLRTFGRQQFRCVDCNSKYRRVPLVGKCTRCGGKIILTIARGSVEKYLGISQKVANQYGLSEYMKQRLELLKREIDEVFENEPTKQVTLDAFM